MTTSYTIGYKGWVLLCPIYLAGDPDIPSSIVAIPRLSFFTFWFDWNIAIAQAMAEIVWAFMDGPASMDFWSVKELAEPFTAIITVDE
jgi:hypothetical protein